MDDSERALAAAAPNVARLPRATRAQALAIRGKHRHISTRNTADPDFGYRI